MTRGKRPADGARWLEAEISIVRNRYRQVARAELMSALPGRTWRAIQRIANKIGVAGACRPGVNRYEIRGGDVAIFLDRRDGGQIETIISLIDLERVLAFGKWMPHSTKAKGGKTYAYCKNSDGRTSLHRFLLSCAPGAEGDHEDGETLNNRRRNLRIVTHSGNGQNQSPISARAASRFRGVYWNKNLDLWVSRVTVNRVDHVKYSHTMEEAVEKVAEMRGQLHPYMPASRELRRDG